MRLYETQDVDFFVDIPNKWELYCQHAPDKSWGHKNLKPYKTMNNYRDTKGAYIRNIKMKDLYLEKKPSTRINPWACLPLLYAVGERFIKLEQAPPNGFKCTEFPSNIKEMRAINERLKIEAAARKAERLYQKRLKEECAKEKQRQHDRKFNLDYYTYVPHFSIYRPFYLYRSKRTNRCCPWC